jgi:cytoskeletal protein CcmA (bactofilin family)
MINFSRGSGDRPPDPQDARNPPKPALRPAVYEAPSREPTQARVLPPDPATLRDTATGTVRPDPPPADRHPAASAVVPAPSPAQQSPASKLFVGINIKLKGVEISDCDLLVIEGHVEATVHSKEMQISQPGTLNGTAVIDVAEVHGEFTGELTARGRLVVHGTGKVSGTIRYGKLIVAEGGTISGDMKQIDAVETRAAPSRGAAHESRHSNASSRGSVSSP